MEHGRINLDDFAISGFDYFLNSDNHQEKKKEIYGLLANLFKSSSLEIDTLVGVDRKGAWIVDNFFAEYPGLKKFNVISDSEIDAKKSMVSKLRVLVFDDSIHTADTITNVISRLQRYKPKNIIVACLLSNAGSNVIINKKYPDIKIVPCKTVFEDFPKQSEDYLVWELPFVDGLKAKDNPDFPKLKITTPEQDLDKIADSICNAIKNSVNNVSDIEIEKVINKVLSRNINVEVEADESVIASPYYKFATVDESKVRAFITKYEGRTEIIVTPLVFPRLDSNGCDIIDTSPNDCLCKAVKLKKKNDEICKLCLPYFVNGIFLDRLNKKINETLKADNILIETIKTERPKIGRFIRIS
ncbi:phosphoribosyltransferase [Methanomassiliicoccus luminyensis]|jgi:hypoxanthine phosphoribosyltransferase|uniref:phosphoribosyltransferase n=1 Tax=Methanomassiliicoccus luminyensis TaxID=1080712 RepID=UPI00138AF757|nr:phosphoribosyltransferase [Methanomassiliicoccus luminyensis]